MKRILPLQKYNNDLLIEQNLLKSKQILNQKKIIWLSFGVLLILIVFLFFLYYNRKRIKLLNQRLSAKNSDMVLLNEELNVTNETLNIQQEQLKALNITKDKFFSILGHDLKSPFNSLLGMLNLLEQHWEDIEDNEKLGMIQSLYASSEKTFQLLEELLSWGKAQQGLIKCIPEVFDVAPRVALVTDLFKAQLKEKEQVLKIDIPEGMKLNTDARLFAQIIQNLLNNAIKYTPHQGTIIISGKISGKEDRICVSDTGIGIPENKISQLFELDSNFNRPGTDNEKSSGMGLILSKEYADIIGAKLSVTSVEERGSTFCLSFKKNIS